MYGLSNNQKLIKDKIRQTQIFLEVLITTESGRKLCFTLRLTTLKRCFIVEFCSKFLQSRHIKVGDFQVRKHFSTTDVLLKSVIGKNLHLILLQIAHFLDSIFQALVWSALTAFPTSNEIF